jgi:hypothetical protein
VTRRRSRHGQEIAEQESQGDAGQTGRPTSHETACLLNANTTDAAGQITIFFSDRGPAGPCMITVPAQRTLHVRFNDLTDPEPIPRVVDYASTMEADVPIVVQHTRLDSRQAETALITTIAFPGEE